MVTEYEVAKQAVSLAIVTLEQAIDAEREVYNKGKYIRSLAGALTNSALEALDDAITLTLGIVEVRGREVSSTTRDSAKNDEKGNVSSTTTGSGYEQLSF